MGIEKKMAQIGITGNLFKLYQASAELGVATIAQVASRAGLIRTTAYDALARLEQEGLICLEIKNGKRYVIAQDPTILLERLEGKRQMLDEVMPQLRSMYNRALGKPQIRFYEGLEGIRQALQDTLTVTSDNKLLRGILSMEELMQTPGREEMEQYVKDRVEKGVQLRVIRSAQKDTHPIWPPSQSALRELRYCPPHMMLSMTVFIYDQRVCLISSKKENYALIIESEEFAAMQRTLFESIWTIGSLP